jgi:hypothetical protein
LLAFGNILSVLMFPALENIKIVSLKVINEMEGWEALTQIKYCPRQAMK